VQRCEVATLLFIQSRRAPSQHRESAGNGSLHHPQETSLRSPCSPPWIPRGDFCLCRARTLGACYAQRTSGRSGRNCPAAQKIANRFFDDPFVPFAPTRAENLHQQAPPGVCIHTTASLAVLLRRPSRPIGQRRRSRVQLAASRRAGLPVRPLGLRVMININGTPKWARRKAPTSAHESRVSPRSRRCSRPRTYGRSVHGSVALWSVWNDPNLSSSSTAVSRRRRRSLRSEGCRASLKYKKTTFRLSARRTCEALQRPRIPASSRATHGRRWQSARTSRGGLSVAGGLLAPELLA